MEYVLEINGVICKPVGEVTEASDLGQFEEELFNFIESKGFTFGGGCIIMTEEDYLKLTEDE